MQNPPLSEGFSKADDGGRTRDLRLGKPTLYQLSYVRADPSGGLGPASVAVIGGPEVLAQRVAKRGWRLTQGVDKEGGAPLD